MVLDVAVVDRDLSERAAADTFSGAIRIDHGATTLLRRGYGWASRTWSVPATPETRFDTASVTKLFTTVATLQQVEAGRFGLDTGAVEYLGLTDTAINPAATVHHLLSHTSGITDDADEDAGEDYADLFIDDPNYRIREASDHLSHFAHKPGNFAPGTATRYCNVSFVLLGMMVEQATGLNYRDYVRAHVFAPAGMDRSGFFAMDVVEPEVAEGVEPIIDEAGRRSGWRRSIYSYPPVGTPDGGAHCTVDDLIAFHTALRNGQLISEASTTAMLTPHGDYEATERGRRWTGYGFELEQVDGRTRKYWKEGHNHGVSAILRHYPEPDLTITMLSNLGSGAWEPLDLIDDLVGD